MMHTRPLRESEGSFKEAGGEKRWCNQCQAETDHRCAAWESSDGAYEDYKYTCTECGTVHWVDGIDS